MLHYFVLARTFIAALLLKWVLQFKSGYEGERTLNLLL